MPNSIKILFAGVLLFCHCLFALAESPSSTNSSHHSGPINKMDAIITASIIVNKLALGGKIDKSWIDTYTNKAIKRQYPSGKEWVVTFHNRKINDREKQTLYIFLTEQGKYVAANYTGQ